MHPSQQTSIHSILVSYLQLRRAIGWTGITLAPALIGGFTFLSPDCPIPPSISHFYFTIMGTYFTGTLIAMALFLFFYSGPQPLDRKIARAAGSCACIVAFVPTNNYCQHCPSCSPIQIKASIMLVHLHYAAAIVLFVLLAFFCLFLFTRTHRSIPPTPQKIWRNCIYRICGYLILSCLVLLAAIENNWLPAKKMSMDDYPYLLVGESIALAAFGISWLIKGAVFLRDH